MKYFIATLFALIHTTAFSAPPYESADYYSEKHCTPKHTFEYDYIPPPPVYIGIPHDRKVKLMSFDEFLTRFEVSLDKHTDELSRWVVKENKAHIMQFNELNSYLYIGRSHGMVHYLQYYMRHGTEKDKKRTHTLSDDDKMAMIETINLVVQDHQKSQEILDELYKRYLGRLELVVDGYISVFLEHDGKYFSLRGINTHYHPIKRCNFKVVYALSIL
ncbi:hypothetical protein LP123_01985 [Moraxella bovis]|uniref:hypothetical protein n=1 Tax=Moraxella bovis TaxID=476 RepID=UPI002227B8C3|nr:hypothetical protein [Moraxella bovis]UZA05895.1 hypothetical protein LP099_12335 [Moraxella bovis]UZA11877.1 hypothetical protein LP123_01985 [Moraxella bovis]